MSASSPAHGHGPESTIVVALSTETKREIIADLKKQSPLELMLKWFHVLVTGVSIILSYGYLQWQTAQMRADITDIRQDLNTNYVRLDVHQKRWNQEDERYRDLRDDLRDIKQDVRELVSRKGK